MVRCRTGAAVPTASWTGRRFRTVSIVFVSSPTAMPGSPARTPATPWMTLSMASNARGAPSLPAAERRPRGVLGLAAVRDAGSLGLRATAVVGRILSPLRVPACPHSADRRVPRRVRGRSRAGPRVRPEGVQRGRAARPRELVHDCPVFVRRNAKRYGKSTGCFTYLSVYSEYGNPGVNSSSHEPSVDS